MGRFVDADAREGSEAIVGRSAAWGLGAGAVGGTVSALVLEPVLVPVGLVVGFVLAVVPTTVVAVVLVAAGRPGTDAAVFRARVAATIGLVTVVTLVISLLVARAVELGHIVLVAAVPVAAMGVGAVRSIGAAPLLAAGETDRTAWRGLGALAALIALGGAWTVYVFHFDATARRERVIGSTFEEVVDDLGLEVDSEGEIGGGGLAGGDCVRTWGRVTGPGEVDRGDVARLLEDDGYEVERRDGPPWPTVIARRGDRLVTIRWDDASGPPEVVVGLGCAF